MNKKHEKTEFFLFIVRHAHRYTLDLSDPNNGLSEKGLKQAARLWGHLKDLHKKYGMPLKSIQLFSSPKRRCQETLAPLSNHLKVPITILDSLDEGGDLGPKCRMIRSFIQETREVLDQDLEKMVGSKVKGEDGHGEALGANGIVLCSHGDVIPELLELLCGIAIQLSKAGSVLLKWDSVAKKFELLQVDQ